MATAYTTTDQVCDKLLRNVRVKIGQDEPDTTNANDISFAGVDQERIGAEAEITMQLSRFYSIPLRLTSRATTALIETLATELSAYKVWLRINPSMTRDDIPASVAQWKKNVDDIIEKVVPRGKSTAQIGRDIILESETLLAGAGAAGTSPIALTQFVPFGGSTS